VTILRAPGPGAVLQGREPVRRREPGNVVVRWLTSTDHKVIGYLYLITSFGFFLIGGWMALIMRAELARPGNQLVTNEQYNQLFTMHGAIMLLLFATPLFVAFTNVIMPLQIGSPDVAFPRLNMFSYLAVPVRRPHRGRRFLHPRRGPRPSAGSLTRR
jgi:cytochrome c oxidase subunit I